jgi:plasmid stability protein
MSQTITLRNLDDNLVTRIQREAQQHGESIEMFILKIVRQGLQSDQMIGGLQEYHDLDALAGTWSHEETTTFLKQIEDFNQVDLTLWS